MQKNHTIQSIKNIADTSKGQKIVAGLYLITNHLSDSDPIKTSIRTHAIGLVESGTMLRASTAEKITTLLGAAVLARIMNEKNVSILVHEIHLFTSTTHTHPQELFGALFDTDQQYTSIIKRTEHTPLMSVMSDTMSLRSKKNESIFENKNKRQHEILSFINERKSVGIKDIALLFTDVSEKTIQRELGTLVANGKITKRGSKRWSMYMSVNPSSTT